MVAGVNILGGSMWWLGLGHRSTRRMTVLSLRQMAVWIYLEKEKTGILDCKVGVGFSCETGVLEALDEV